MRKIVRISDRRAPIDFLGVTKEECMSNFIKVFGANNSTIAADNCKQETLDFLKTLGVEDIRTTNLGKRKSFEFVLEIIKEMDDSEVVYLCDDDFLHLPSAPSMIEEGLKISKYVTLYDCMDKYIQKSPNPYISRSGEITRLLLTPSSYWKFPITTKFSSIAFLAQTLKEDLPIVNKHMTDNGLNYIDCSVELILERSRSFICSLPGHATECNNLASPFVNWLAVVKTATGI